MKRTQYAKAGMLVVAALGAALLATACTSERATGKAVGAELTVAAPVAKYPVLTQYKNQTGKAADGSKVNKYSATDNPVIGLLSGFDKIWTVGDPEWFANANGDGPKDFSKVKIVNPKVWQENIAYCEKVTGAERTPAKALQAYLDDRRDQKYSLIDGLGPLATFYIEGSGAASTVNHKLGDADFDANKVIDFTEDDKGTGAGTSTSALAPFVAFMEIIRGPEGTTSPAKYYYSSPRPWRMNSKGEVRQTGTETLGGKTFELYETNVKLLPALYSARETRGRQKDGAYPSGHTNAAYLTAFAYAYAVPERYAELLTRASEFADNRIVAGMHNPVDIIGGRIMATALAAAYLNDPANAAAKKAAFDSMESYFASRIPAGVTLASFAQTGADADRFADDAANKKLYREHLTSGFSQDKANAGKEMIVPAGAEVLLETRLPYLTAAQRRAVLYTTGLDSGYPIIDDSEGWGRLDVVSASAGYGAFAGDVAVTMDASLGGFNALDAWTNDIGGKGKLTKKGTGTLGLSGNNTYSGGTSIENGTILALSKNALGTSGVSVSGGTLAIASKETATIGGSLAVSGGNVSLDVSGTKAAALSVNGTVTVAGGKLAVSFRDFKPATGTIVELISAKKISGTFADIAVDGYAVTPVYNGKTVAVKIDSVK